MSRRYVFGIGAVVLLAVTAVACFNRLETKPIAAVNVPAELGKPPYPLNFDPAIFDANSAKITNPWFPLKPGTQWIWEGSALDGEEAIDRKLIMTVTDATKKIAGVNTLVAWDRDYDNGMLAESEIIFLAQDKSGNVWHFGQSVERYDEEGKLDGSETWLVGYLKGAEAGILMPADPKAGTPEFKQGLAPPPYFWDDVAIVDKTGLKNCVRAGCYENVLVIKEFEPTKPDAWQTKFWVKGVGNIRTDWGGKAELEKEELELIRKRTLTAKELAEARNEALAIEMRQRVYGLTTPMVVPNGRG